ncbi:hypothetical protein ACRWQN_03890 [Shewanella sp. HL-SH8]|uniref:hypothetical protein n=1 Tax=unclassified Shewanella TaxID=196818 RepID=UPI003EBF7697
MEAFTAATTFATIVGLLSNFKSERKASSDNEYQEFVSWLDSKRHKSLMEEITSNHLLGLGIKSLLNQNHEVVLKKLASLDETLLVLSSSIGGFKEISNALAPNVELSEQAISIISQLNSTGGSSFTENKGYGLPSFIFMDTQGSIEITEQRFIEDDLAQLVNLDLLILDYSSHGNRVFRITRMAVKLLEQM